VLINPYTKELETHPGCRMLVSDLGLVGASFTDVRDGSRNWNVVGLYAPIKVRRLGGIRAKIQDQKGFISFCNQRDLELLLGMANPGDMCPWTDSEYPEILSDDFFGPCADSDDLWDDMYEREVYLRRMMEEPQYPDVIPHGYQLTRRVHLHSSRDVEQLDMMIYDCDPETGYGPDNRFETINSRWTNVERRNVRWATI